MTEALIDNRRFKVYFGVFVAFPATLILLFCSIYAFVFSVALFQEFNRLIAPLVLAYYLGLIGFVGAWIRLIKTKQDIGAILNKWIRSFLMSGLLASAILFGLFIFNGWYTFLVLPVGLAVIGLGFIGAT